MIIDNLGLSYLLPKIELFLWQITSRTLLKNLTLFTGGNDSKVALCQINLLLC